MSLKKENSEDHSWGATVDNGVNNGNERSVEHDDRVSTR